MPGPELEPAPKRKRKWLRVVLLLIVVVLGPPRYGVSGWHPWWEPYLDRFVDENFQFPSPLEPGEATRQLAALRDKLGYRPQAVQVWLDKGGTTIEVPDPKLLETTNSWHISSIRLLRRYQWFEVSGPQGVQSQTMPSVRQRLMDLGHIDFGLVSAIAEAASKRAAFQEAASVTAMELSNLSVSRLGETGPVRWRVTVESPHEKAVVYADPAGRLTGADLSQTLRARTLDLFQGGQPLHDMVAALAVRFGDSEQIESASISSSQVSVAIDSHNVAREDAIYASDINGVSRSPFGMNHALGSPYRDFSVREVDWDAVPRLIERARALLGAPDAEIWDIEIQKYASCAPGFHWTVTLKDASGSHPEIVLDDGGFKVAC